MNERFKAVRLALGVSQDAFGERIGIKGSGISNIESGIRNVSERHIKLLHSVYGVSDEWLRSGNGEMFMASDSGMFQQFADEYGLDDVSRSAVLAFAKLPERDRRVVLDALRAIADACRDTAASDLDKADRRITDQLHGQ